jgi:TAT (twin-arginine translocation) pathway-exported protein
MNRRDFLRSTGAASASVALARTRNLLAEGTPPDRWRTFEVNTRVEILKPSGVTRVWLPASLIGNTPFQKTLSNEFNAEGGTAEIIKNKTDALGSSPRNSRPA